VAALEAARQRSGVQAGVTVIQACPHCGSEVIVLTTLIAGTALFQKPEPSTSPTFRPGASTPTNAQQAKPPTW
jgi:hypothetical protein